jgi:uncharacterized protein
MENIVGRKSQIGDLQAAMVSNRAEMVALIGRRRIGKTFLVKQVYENRINFELTGIQYANKKEQIQNFLMQVAKYCPNHEVQKKPDSWLEAFFLLANALENQKTLQKKVVFIDELPWLGSKRSDFIKGLSWFWNSWAESKKIVLVICGSAASWMIKKVINDKGGLHNRVTKLIYLYPFTLNETEEFLKNKQVKLNRYQITQIYMTMGGVPMYLDQLKPGLSAIQNIQKVCFEQEGYLRNEFYRLYSSLFNNFENHVEIIKALAKKRVGLTRNQIIENTKFKNGGMLTEILDELEKSGFIEVNSPFEKLKRESLYRITDQYSMFYLTFLEKLPKNSNIDFQTMSSLPKWKAWSGYSFENVCFYHIKQIKQALGISGINSSTSSFFAQPKDNLPGTQIDLLIDRSDNCINLCEMKFSNDKYEVTKKDLENIMTKKSVFRYHSKTNKHIFTTLITTFGAIENSNKIGNIDQVVSLDNLFA